MYDALRADCSIQPSREFSVDEPLTLRSTTAISPDGLWLAATSAYGSTFVFNVRSLCTFCFRFDTLDTNSSCCFSAMSYYS